MIQSLHPKLPIQFEMKFALKTLEQLLQLIIESSNQCVHELFLLWPQERMVDIVPTIDMEVLIPRVDIKYLKFKNKCKIY